MGCQDVCPMLNPPVCPPWWFHLAVFPVLFPWFVHRFGPPFSLPECVRLWSPPAWSHEVFRRRSIGEGQRVVDTGWLPVGSSGCQTGWFPRGSHAVGLTSWVHLFRSPGVGPPQCIPVCSRGSFAGSSKGGSPIGVPILRSPRGLRGGTPQLVCRNGIPECGSPKGGPPRGVPQVVSRGRFST
jgi:hypothetical protein